MKKTFRRIAAVLAAVILTMSVIGRVSADETLRATNVKVEITVNENNTFDIVETIDIEFATPHHGIIRTIPLYNSIYRQDGSYSSNYAIVSNVTCNENYSTYASSSDYEIKIGRADVEIEGHKQYVIGYNYDIGNDTMKHGDEFYFNVIGTEWTYKIEHLEVIIHMPKEFDFSKFGLSHGAEGTIDYTGAWVKNVGNDIYIDYPQTLQPGEAFTVRCEMEENYFKKTYSLFDILSSILCPLTAVLMMLLNRRNYHKYGKPESVVQTVEFYPPENVTPPQMYHAIYNHTSNESVNGLLLLLASKGYLIIEDEGDEYRFILLDKPTDELSPEEKTYLGGLWERGSIQEDGSSTVTKDELDRSFYRTVSDVRYYINTNKNDRVYEKGQKKYAVFSFFTGINLIMIIPVILFMATNNRGFRWYHWAAIAVSVIAGLYQMIVAFKYHRRTQRNNRLYGRILGFREFLLLAEKDRLEMLVEENPSYFYDVLPYAYALNVTDVWIRKFEGMLIEPASWYSGSDFTYFMDHGMHDFEYDSLSVPYSSSSDSSYDSSDSSGWSSSSDSGGGYSGGGSGGGGSSGW